MSTNTKSGKKDQSIRRDVSQQVEEVIPDRTDNAPQIRKPNRDQARGDWDRSRKEQD